MDSGLIVPNTTAFRVIEKDPGCVTTDYFIHSLNSQSQGGPNLRIKVGSNGTDAVVEFTGADQNPDESLFKVHRCDDESLLESISSKAMNWMLFVDAQNQLSARKKTTNYSRGADAASDEKFELINPIATSSVYNIKWKKGNKYIGSDKNGQAVLLDKIEGDEGNFYLVPVS